MISDVRATLELICDLEHISLWEWQWKMQFDFEKTEEMVFLLYRSSLSLHH